MTVPAIPIPKDELAALCRRWHIRKLSLFGSVLRDDFGPDSDVDVLVEFERGHVPGWSIITLENELSLLFGGRRVYLVMPSELNRWIKKRVLDSAEVQYVAAG
jgi:predicted nucleotidyltransferase